MKKWISWISIICFCVLSVTIVAESIHIMKKNSPKGQAAEKQKQERAFTTEKQENKEDIFYLDLSYFQLWESGDYSIEDGSAYEHRRRLRYTRPVEIIYNEYTVNMSEDYCLSFFEYNNDMAFIKSTIISDGESFLPEADTQYIKISLFRTYLEKQLSPGQWNRLFPEIKILISHGDIDQYLDSKKGSLVSTSMKMVEGEELVNALLNDESELLANQLWTNQIITGAYSLTYEEINNKSLTLYFSSSEGNDKNSGLSAEFPKKSPQLYSGTRNVNILLKCGDVFHMPQRYSLGSNSILASYGEGIRPVMSFYQDLDLTYTRVDGLENVWMADLSVLTICNGMASKSNCNIGQLLIAGEVNWKRKIWSTKNTYDPIELSHVADGSWATDWHTSRLYMYSQVDPNELEIQYAPPFHGIAIYNAKNVVMKGIEIKGAGCHGVNIKDSEDVEVTNCYFHHIGGSILVSAGTRYGNAVQIWDSGQDITVAYNYADWIFDTCYTNQGADTAAYEDNIKFYKNIGAHSFWGLEMWGNGYSEKEFGTIEYFDNVIYATMDITSPDMPMYSGTNGRVIFAQKGRKEEDYVSYRYGYTYQQMSAININNWGTQGKTKAYQNLFWNTNRFLALITNTKKEEVFSSLMDNLFYCETDVAKPAPFRYTISGTRKYLNNLSGYVDDSNVCSVHSILDKYDNHKEHQVLVDKLSSISGIQ